MPCGSSFLSSSCCSYKSSGWGKAGAVVTQFVLRILHGYIHVFKMYSFPTDDSRELLYNTGANTTRLHQL